MEDGIYKEAASATLKISIHILWKKQGSVKPVGDEREGMRQAPGKIPPLSADVHGLLCRRPGLALASLLWLGRRKCYEQPSPNRYPKSFLVEQKFFWREQFHVRNPSSFFAESGFGWERP